MLKDSQVRFDLPMIDIHSRSLNQSYGQIPAKSFNKMFSTHLPWNKMVNVCHRYTVYSRYIAVVYIAELDISRSHVGPHFLAPKSKIFF